MLGATNTIYVCFVRYDMTCVAIPTEAWTTDIPSRFREIVHSAGRTVHVFCFGSFLPGISVILIWPSSSSLPLQVQNLELLDSRAEQAQRSDRSDANLWESERLQRSDAAALRQQGGGGGGGGGGGAMGGGGAYQQQMTPEELEAKARKKAAEDKWWSAEPEAAEGGGGGDSVTGSKSGESSWWEEEDGARGGGGGGGAASKGIDADSLPSFFDS